MIAVANPRHVERLNMAKKTGARKKDESVEKLFAGTATSTSTAWLFH